MLRYEGYYLLKLLMRELLQFFMQAPVVLTSREICEERFGIKVIFTHDINWR